MDQALHLLRQGRPADALAAALAAYDARQPQHRLWLGLIFASNQRAAEAADLLGQALRPGEGNPQHWRVLGSARGLLGDKRGEVDALTQAIALDPQNALFRRFRSAAWLEAGEPEKALLDAMDALKLEDSTEARRLFVEAAPLVPSAPPEARALLKRAFVEAWGPFYRLSRAALPFIMRSDDLAADDLLAAALERGPVHDPELERRLTALRRRYLLDGGGPGPFTRALARQCWINEYCWRVTPEEEAALASLDPHNPLRSLYTEPPNQADAPAVPSLTPIRGGVSSEVRAMYEQNPYPRWVLLPEQDPQPAARVLGSMFPTARLDPIPGAEILVAGCGTGLHALQTARRYQGARVLAIDLSLASLGYAATKARELGVQNVTFGQADILELGALGRSFDIITCAGTLQAMADPEEGFRVLRGLLRPGGVIHLGLYSKRAREELAAAQAFARDFPPTRAGIQKMRAAIMDAPEAAGLRAALGWNDFYTTSNARDLLMHVMEHQHTISDVRQMVAGSGLRFIGIDAPSDVLAAYRARFPRDPAASNLDNWDQLERERPLAFRNMYQIWMQRPLA